jgi:hypothetical protein
MQTDHTIPSSLKAFLRHQAARSSLLHIQVILAHAEIKSKGKNFYLRIDWQIFR